MSTVLSTSYFHPEEIKSNWKLSHGLTLAYLLKNISIVSRELGALSRSFQHVDHGYSMTVVDAAPGCWVWHVT